MRTPAEVLVQLHEDQPAVIAHRGASGNAPENTLASFRLAMSLGAKYAETDVCLSKDGRVMAIHDETLERTTTGSGRVDTKTYDELRNLDAGRWFGSSFANEKIPELAELLRFINGEMVLCIEIKGGDGIVSSICEIIEHTKAADHVVFFAFDPGVVREVKRRLPRNPMVYLVHIDAPPWEYPPTLINDALELEADAIGVYEKGAHTVDIAQAHRAGLPIFAYTVNEPDQVDRMAELGIDGIITDFPRRTLARLTTRVNAP